MDDSLNHSVEWKKQYSQDGREYHVNTATGEVRHAQATANSYKPKTLQRKESMENKGPRSTSGADNQKKGYSSAEFYIQQYTTDKVPFFVHMRTGVSSWTLPEGTPQSAVKYITHLTDQGIPYYEDTEKKTTTWTLPLEKLSTAARRSSMALRKMNRRQSNVFMQTTVQDFSTAVKESEDSEDSDGSRSRESGTEDRGERDISPLSSTRVRRNRTAKPKGQKRYSNIASSKPTTGGGSESPSRWSDGEDDEEERDSAESLGALVSKKPFGGGPRDLTSSPTLSDVSSVTSPSVAVTGSAATSLPAGVSGSAVGRSDLFGDNSCTRPLVRIVFEKYKRVDTGAIDLNGLQELCYDYGTHLTTDDLHLATKDLDGNGDGSLEYEEFMVWWRTNDRFSTAKTNDAHTKLRTEAAAAFKQYDRGLTGEISRQEFSRLHHELQRAKLQNPQSSNISGDKVGNKASSQYKRANSISKFFGSILGGSNDKSDVRDDDITEKSLVRARDHPDYAKYFRMADVGGNPVDIRRQMREVGLDDALIQTPEKMISSEVKINYNDHLKLAREGTAAAYLDRVNGFEFHDDESDGMSTAASSVVTGAGNTPATTGGHVSDKAFVDMFKKKPSTSTDVLDTVVSGPTSPAVVEVFICKPLGITLGENEPDAEMGVHVASCAPEGNAAATGKVKPGMLLMEACGHDVRRMDFDSIMDILRAAPAGNEIHLVFSDTPADDARSETEGSEEQEADESVAEETIQPVSSPEEHATDPIPPSNPVAISSHNIVPTPMEVTADVDIKQKSASLRSTGSFSQRKAAAMRNIANRKHSGESSQNVVASSGVASATDVAYNIQGTDVPTPAATLSSSTDQDSDGGVYREDAHVETAVDDGANVFSDDESEGIESSSDAETDGSERNTGVAEKPVESHDSAMDFGNAAPLATSDVAITGSASKGSAIFGLPDHLEESIGADADVQIASQFRNSKAGDSTIYVAPDETVQDQDLSKHESAHTGAHRNFEGSENVPVVDDTSALESSLIIGRPKHPRRHPPSFLLRRARGGDNTRPTRGGIARVSNQNDKSRVDQMDAAVQDNNATATIQTSESNGLSMGFMTPADDFDAPPSPPRPRSASPEPVSDSVNPIARVSPGRANTVGDGSSPTRLSTLPRRRGNSALGKTFRSSKSKLSTPAAAPTVQEKTPSNAVERNDTITDHDAGGFSPLVKHRPLMSYDSVSSHSSVASVAPAAAVPPVQTAERGTQSDYVCFIDEEYLNSYQMILGEKREVAAQRERLRIETEEATAMLRKEEQEVMDRISSSEIESMKRIKAEEDILRERVQEVEDIILIEKEDIERQWDELRAAETEAYHSHKARTEELLDLMHIVRAHHEKLLSDKKRIARQRLQLDLALQDLNRFNSFSPGGSDSSKAHHRRKPHTFDSSNSRRWPSPSFSNKSIGGSTVNGPASVGSKRWNSPYSKGSGIRY